MIRATTKSVLIIGQCFNYATAGYACGHNVEARDLGVGRGLARLGWRVHMVATAQGHTDDDLISFHPWLSIDYGSYDAIVCIEAGCARARTQGGGIFPAGLQEHSNVIALMDSFDQTASDMSFFKAVGFSSERTVKRYEAVYPGRSALYAPFAFTAPTENLSNPYPQPADRVVYVGTVTQHVLDELNRLAGLNGFEVWVAGLFTNRPGSPALSDEERATLVHPGVRWISDYAPLFTTGENHNGPVRYDAVWPFTSFASAGLCFSTMPYLDQIHGKIQDYLSVGLPVICEEGPPNVSLVRDLDAGTVVPFREREHLDNAIRHELAHPRDKSRIREAAQRLCSWGHVAEIVDAQLRLKAGS